MKSAQRGFTLIELLVVIAIIGLLASVILAALNSARTKGRDARRVSDFKSVQNALELYNDASSSYAYSQTWSTGALGTTLASYISGLPVDPVNSGSYVYAYYGLTSANATCTSGSCPGYLMYGAMENALPPSSLRTGTYATIDCSAGTLRYCVKN